MKTKFIFLGLLMISIGFNLYLITQPSTSKRDKNPYRYRLPDDTRENIKIKPEYREFLLKEMREFVNSISHITQGIETHNPDLVIQGGERSGTSVTPPEGLPKIMPKAFLEMGHPTHVLFDAIADSARTRFDSQTTQSQLRELMNRCVACHASYRLEPSYEIPQIRGFSKGSPRDERSR